MKQLHEQIEQLTTNQINALAAIVVKQLASLPDKERQHISLIQQFDKSNDGALIRLLLHAIIEKEEEIAKYIKAQLSNNRKYLATIKTTENFRSFSESIPYAITLITALGVNIQWEIKEGKLVKFELSTGLLAVPIIATLFKSLKTKVEGKNILINSELKAENIHIGDTIQNTTYDKVGSIFNIDHNAGNIHISESTTDNSAILEEIQSLKASLSLTKIDILESIQQSNIQLEKSLVVAFQKMSNQESLVVQKALEDAQFVSLDQANKLLVAITEAMDSISTDLQSEATALKQLLVSKEKISTKLRVAIPFLPFVSVLHEYDGNNPLHVWWKKIRNIVL